MLTVSAPKQRFHGPRIAEVRPKRVEAWLGELPQADAEDSMQQILQALFVQNRTTLDPCNRLGLMELYHQPVLNIADSLASTYTASSFPLSERRHALATAIQQLCLELANGFKIVANDLTTRDVVKKHKLEFVHSIQRSTETLSRAIADAYAVYRPSPEGVWHDLHQLYRISETHGILDYPVADFSNKLPEGESATIRTSYERALLIGACNPLGLLQGECGRLFKMIPQWYRGIQISEIRSKSKKDRVGHFLINLMSDSAPIPMVKLAWADIDSDKEEHMRVLNTLEVVREVHAALKRWNHKSTSSQGTAPPGSDAANADLLRRFGRILGGVNIARHSTRTKTDQHIPICVGMNATHFFASGQRRFQPSQGAGAFRTVRQTAENQEYFDMSDPEIGNSHKIEPSITAPVDPWQQSTIHRLFSCRVENQSATGLCVHTSGPTEFRVRVGDLVGLQFPTPDRWRVGVIRWMRNGAELCLDLGIQMLAPDLYPVAVKRLVKGGEDVPDFQALLLPSNATLKQPESVLVPRGGYQPGDTLVLHRGGGEQTVISPLQLIDRTGSYDQLLVPGS